MAAAGHLALRRLMAQVALPFEVRAARDYSRQYGIPWRPLDLGGPSRRHLPRYARELLTPENFQTLLTTEDEPLEDFVAREYRRAHLSCRRPTWRLPGLDPETRRRERLQVRRLRHYLGRYARVAHLGGWEHLAPWRDGDGLWAGLAELQPLRLFLDEADHEIIVSHAQTPEKMADRRPRLFYDPPNDGLRPPVSCPRTRPWLTADS